MGGLLILFMVAFAVQKFLSSIRSHLFIFGFILISPCDIAATYTKEFSAYVFPQGFESWTATYKRMKLGIL